MFVKLSAGGQITLEERDNFHAFKLVVAGNAEQLDAVRKALSGVAEILDATHAWIFEQALRQRPEVAADAGWQQSLGAMIEKARPHGWIDDQRKAIKAHIEWAAG
jgi:predicted transcriptional regulator